MMCIVATVIWGGNVYGQTSLPATFGDDVNGVTISKSDDGNTLFIKGHGDLTLLPAEYYFVNTLSGNTIFKKSGDNYNAVQSKDSYDENETYATRSNVYTALEKEIFEEEHVYDKVTYNYTFLVDAVGVFYTRQQTGWDAVNNTAIYTYNPIAEGEKVNTQTEWDNGTVSKYFTRSGEEGNYTYERVIPVEAITGNEAYVKSEEIHTPTLKNINEIYCGDNHAKVYDDNKYDEAQTYYSLSYDYTVVDLTDLLDKKYLVNESQFFRALSANAECENIIFVNDNAGTAPLYIADDVANNLLYIKKGDDWGNVWYVCNSVTKKIDFGAATCKDFSATTFAKTNDPRGTLSLETIIFPLAETDNEGNVVFPSNLWSTCFEGLNSLATAVVPEGYTKLGKEAFKHNTYVLSSNLKEVKLPSTLLEIGDYAFNGATGLTSFIFNEGLKTIGKFAFYGASNLGDVTFPESLDKIDDCAFVELKNIRHLEFNKNLRYIGNSAFGVTSSITDQSAITIPKSVRYIGPAAFNNRQYQDVYFMCDRAPVMPMGQSAFPNANSWCQTAFPEQCLMGNNGFVPSYKEETGSDNVSIGYANRQNYINGGAYFTILHYPQSIDDTDVLDTYRDYTRVYMTSSVGETFNQNNKYKVGSESELLSGGGAQTLPNGEVTLGFQDTYLGRQYVWPSQSQWMRAYITNLNGVRWDGVTKYRPTLTPEELAVLKEAGYVPTDEGGTYSKDELRKIAHMGTRLFVFTQADVNNSDEYSLGVKGGNWWTICLPINMTKKRVMDVFGDGVKAPHVCRFSAVDRTEKEGKKSIVLKFQDDVYKYKWVKTVSTDHVTSYDKVEGNVEPDDDDIVIYAHEAYMIYPTKTSQDWITITGGFASETGSPRPTVIQANAANTATTDHKEYRFIGNYMERTVSSQAALASQSDKVTTQDVKEVTIPQYSYIYTRKKGSPDLVKNDPYLKFFFYGGTTSKWKENRCVVQATAKDGGETDLADFFGGNANNAKVTQLSLFGEDSSTTGVENITIIAGEGEDAQVVYNLNGQVVSHDGKMDGLKQGIYIKGGKKYIVK